MPRTKRAFIELIGVASDGERHALTAECRDWDKLIAPALGEYAQLLPVSIATDPEGNVKMLRVLLESIYYLGYKRGKAEQKLPVFVVADEQS